ncbi:MAG: HAD family hydrolase, partial [Planctomycetaceae bacterium]
MREASRRRRTVVFDLDDTLYDEADYVRSGKLAIAELVSRLYGTDITEILLNEPGDFLEAACQAIQLPMTAKPTLLWTYRLHRPRIEPRAGAHELWMRLRQRGDAICILTDGRAITQRLKVEALGMAPDGLYISEDLGAEKPSPVGFRRVEQEFPADEYIYVADNPKKDFIAPIQIGWRTFGLSPRPSSVHRSSWSTAPQ